jgi:hypothetical protein
MLPEIIWPNFSEHIPHGRDQHKFQRLFYIHHWGFPLNPSHCAWAAKPFQFPHGAQPRLYGLILRYLGNTWPLNEISQVMAIFGSTARCDNRETRQTARPIPTDGPSLGIVPTGKVTGCEYHGLWRGCFLRNRSGQGKRLL